MPRYRRVFALVCGAYFAFLAPQFIGPAFGSTGSGGGSSVEQLAQSITDLTVEELQTEQDRLFRIMLEDPDDLDIAFRYAAVSSRLGDPEAAITALERMLLFNPDLPRVRLELGVLYYRLRSFDVAETYFREALEAANVPSDVAARVNDFLAEIERQRDPHRWTGHVMIGARHQDNANAGPGDETITLGGREFLLDDASQRQADTDVFVSGSVAHFYQYGFTGDVLLTQLSVYANRYFDDQDLNVGVISVDVGPQIDLTRFGQSGTAIRPFAQVEAVRLGQQPYYYAVGGGLEVTRQTSETLTVSAIGQVSARDFSDTGDRPLSSERDGVTATAAISGRYRLSSATHVTTTARAGRDWADADFESRVHGSMGVELSHNFDGPVSMGPPTWTVSVGVSAGFSVFDAEEPPETDARRDRDLRLRTGITIPVTDAVSATGQLEQTLRHSNYDVNKFTNTSVLGGLALRF